MDSSPAAHSFPRSKSSLYEVGAKEPLSSLESWAVCSGKVCAILERSLGSISAVGMLIRERTMSVWPEQRRGWGSARRGPTVLTRTLDLPTFSMCPTFLKAPLRLPPVYQSSRASYAVAGRWC